MKIDFDTRYRVLDNGCWEWTGQRCHGYGYVKVAGKIIGAHRIAYERTRGPIAPGMVIDHLCRRPLCVNPEHLEVVTPAENTRRGAPATKTECINGHPLDEANTYRRLRQSGGARQCRACNRAAVARLKARKSGAHP